MSTSPIEESQREVPPGVLQASVETLGPGKLGKSELRDQLQRIGTAFLCHRELAGQFALPSEQKRVLKRLADVLAKAALIAQSVAPEVQVTLENMWMRERGEAMNLHLAGTLASAQRACATLHENYTPPRGRPADVDLEEAVADLVELFCQHTGAKPMTSNTLNAAKSLTLISAEARAIGALLRALDTRLTDTALVNMIDAVIASRRSEHSLDTLFRADPDGDLDASLLPRRQPGD